MLTSSNERHLWETLPVFQLSLPLNPLHSDKIVQKATPLQHDDQLHGEITIQHEVERNSSYTSRG